MTAKTLNQRSNSTDSISAISSNNIWNDSVLIERALAGDTFAENAIFRRHAPYLLNLAARLTRRISESDDIVQETFLTAFAKLGKLEKPEAFKLWLVRILVSKVRKTFRVRRLKAFFGMDSGREDATLLMLAVHDANPDLRSELKEIDTVLQKMPIDWRTTWMFHRIEGMSIKETAETVNRSVATVKRYVTAVDVAVKSRYKVYNEGI